MAKFKKPSIDEASSSTSNSPQKISDSLFMLFEPAPPVMMDIIFFHGLQFEHNSDAYLSTWRRGGESQEVWPQMWLPEKYPGARILSVSYDASIRTTNTEGRMDMHLIGENLLEDILRARKIQGIEYCPIVLVGHSFGGLVIKQLCLHAYRNKSKGQDISKFLDSIRGIFFYGTPHRGFDELLWKHSKISSMRANKPLLSFAELLGKMAARLHEEFEQRWRDYKWRIYGLGELHAMEGKRDPLVPEASSRFGDNYLTDESDHFSICRPVSTTSNRYLHLVDLIDIVYVERSRQVVLNVVGVESLQTEVQKHLQKHTFLGFCGMGGVGKTTMARVAFNTLSSTFEYTCFVSEVKLIQGNKEEIKEKVWKNMRRHGQSVPGGTSADMWAEVTGKKLLVVFDDIETFRHAELLQEIADDNGSKESRFIITSRNAGVLGYFGVDRIYICDVPFLKDEFARELFITHAFPNGKEPPEHLKHIMEDVVEGCAGLPLTLVVLGKYLGTITDDKIWSEVLDAVRNVEEIPNLDLEERVWRKLQLSYDGLGDSEKHMFLDIASFLLVENPPFSLEEIRSAWSSMYRYVNTRWKTLVDRSLVQEKEAVKVQYSKGPIGTWYRIGTSRTEWTTDHGDDRRKVTMRIHMHEHLRRMGQRIAKMSSRYVSLIDDQWGEHLIHPEKVVALFADISHLSHCSIGDNDIGQFDESSCKLQKFFSQLKGISYLRLTLRSSFSCERCKIIGGFSLPSGLVLLRWEGSNADLKLAVEASVCKSLVVLILAREDDCSLDILSSQACGYLSSLERLTIRSRGLVRLSHALGSLSMLKHLEIDGCGRLERLAETFGNLSRLEHLKISGCRVLERLPETFGNLSRLEYLEIRECAVLKRLPETFGRLSRLEHLEITECVVLERLPQTFGNLSRLEHLVISRCFVLERLPETFGNLSRLEYLQISHCVVWCDALERLSEIKRCSALERLSETFGNLRRLERLEIKRCGALERLPETFGNLSMLEHLEISECGVLERLPETFGNLSRLKRLEIKWCGVLERLSETFGNLSKLEHLEISGCGALERLPETFGNLSMLEHLEISGCGALERLPETFGNLSMLEHLEISECGVLERLPETFGNLSRLERLEIKWCGALERLPETFGNLSRLERLEIKWCYALERLSETFGNLSRLERLEIKWCYALERLPETFGNLSKLEHLEISGCGALERLPETFGNLSKLEHLEISGCGALERLPETFGNLSKLEHLEISGCGALERLPETFENLSRLERLEIRECGALERLPETFGNLSKLEHLEISECGALERLPETFGDLSRLERLEIERCGALERLPETWRLVSAMHWRDFRRYLEI